jgi:hypothetical protein
VVATLPNLTEPFAAAAQGSSLKQAVDQFLEVLADGLAWVVGFVEALWAWASDQIGRLMQVPWGSWPLWKQVVFVLVAAAVLYALFVVASQLWWATLNVLSSVASFVGTLIVTLPTIVLAGAIALGGLWLINNFHDMHSITGFFHGHDGPATTGSPPADKDRDHH